MIILQLLWSFLQIGFLSIGGGYATIPLIQEQIVESHHWLTINELTDMVAISQMTPGPLAVNASTFVGLRVAGIVGAIVATIGTISTGCILTILLYRFFKKHQNSEVVLNVLKGLRASSTGLIATAAVTITFTAFFWTSSFKMEYINFYAITMFIVIMYLLRKHKWNPIALMVLSGVIGIIVYS